MRRVGILGHGHIARALVAHAATDPDLSVVFVRNRTAGSRAGDLSVRPLPPTQGDLEEADLVIEAAHPEVVAEQGARVLQHADLMVTSAAALVDAALLNDLMRSAGEAGTRLILPQGALVGLEAVLLQREDWKTATITMTKAPAHLDPPPHGIHELTVLHDGPVATLAERYPRNVNAMATFALASLGLDGTRCRLVCDPAATTARLEMDLRGHTGARLTIVKEQPMVGVSGSEMPASIIASLTALPANPPPGLIFA